MGRSRLSHRKTRGLDGALEVSELKMRPGAKHGEAPEIGVVRAQALCGVELRHRLRGFAAQHESQAEAVVRQSQVGVQAHGLAELCDRRRVIAQSRESAP